MSHGSTEWVTPAMGGRCGSAFRFAARELVTSDSDTRSPFGP